MKRTTTVLLRVFLLCLIVLGVFSAYQNGKAQTFTTTKLNLDFQLKQPRKVVFTWPLAPNWLTAERVNHEDDPDGWHPSYTHIEVDKAYRPIVREHEDGSFEILFESVIRQPKR